MLRYLREIKFILILTYQMRYTLVKNSTVQYQMRYTTMQYTEAVQYSRILKLKLSLSFLTWLRQLGLITFENYQLEFWSNKTRIYILLFILTENKKIEVVLVRLYFRTEQPAFIQPVFFTGYIILDQFQTSSIIIISDFYNLYN